MRSPADAGLRLRLQRMCTWLPVRLLAVRDLKHVRKLGLKLVRLPQQGRKLARSQAVPHRKQGPHRGLKRVRKQGRKLDLQHVRKPARRNPLDRKQGPHRRLVRLSIPQRVRLPGRRSTRNRKSPRKDARSNGEEIPVIERDS